MKTRKKISARLLVIMLVATLLLPFTWNVPVEAAETKQIDALMDTVDKNYLADFGYTREEVLDENDVEFNSLEEMGTMHEELNLGDIISDAYIYAVENSEYYDGDPVDVAVVPSGTVRDTYTKGDITVEEVFNSFSLGIGKDGVAGLSADQCIPDRKGAEAGSGGGRFCIGFYDNGKVILQWIEFCI